MELAMADQPNQENNEEIRRHLIRTAIKQPLLAMIQEDPDNNDRQIPVIIEVNDDYFDGKEKALLAMQNLVKATTALAPASIGSDQNPYYRASLTAKQVLDIVDQDDANAFRQHGQALENQAGGGQS